ncbi:MAG: response regulator [Desulfobacterales bacterium]|nr:response regulator [Desulfobacterales bacterium]MBF0395716.1 response regulator [Desulfobacterales bacterium]
MIEEENGNRLARRFYLEWELYELKERIEKLESSHGDSLALLMENEYQKLELEDLNRKLEQADKFKSIFLATMSHEIRTPMNGIIATLDLILNESPDHLKKYLKIIHLSSHSLLGIINDILDFSKIEAGKLELEKKAFYLSDVLETIIGIFVSRALEKNIEIVLDIDPHVTNSIIGDSLRLQQVLTNFIGNAIKFTPRGGVITLGAKNTQSLEERVEILFYIKDTGTGIKSEYFDKLFDPFSQENVSTTRKYGGTGLGLFINKQLIEMMKGTVWVKSEMGKGSIFYFTAWFDTKYNETKLSYQSLIKLSGLSALIVDDCCDSRNFLIKTLNFFNFKAEACTSGEEALHKLKKCKYDLILLDALMPIMDGVTTSKKIRQVLNISTPIILNIPFGKDIEYNESVCGDKSYINFVLTKPIMLDPLFKGITEALGINKKQEPIIQKPKKEEELLEYKAKLKGASILVAEDNQTNQQIIMAVLKLAGIEVTIVETGVEAVALVKTNRFDAVLMDIEMPEMDGFEATKIIRKELNYTKLPIIAMTAHAMKGDEEKCINAGMDAHITKPINQLSLFKTLCNILK